MADSILIAKMTVLSACGMSTKRLVIYTMIPALFVMLLVGLLVLV